MCVLEGEVGLGLGSERTGRGVDMGSGAQDGGLQAALEATVGEEKGGAVAVQGAGQRGILGWGGWLDV